MNCDSYPTHVNLTSNVNLFFWGFLCKPFLESPPTTHLFVLNMLFGHREEECGLVNQPKKITQLLHHCVGGRVLSFLFKTM